MTYAKRLVDGVASQLLSPQVRHGHRVLGVLSEGEPLSEVELLEYFEVDSGAIQSPLYDRTVELNKLRYSIRVLEERKMIRLGSKGEIEATPLGVVAWDAMTKLKPLFSSKGFSKIDLNVLFILSEKGPMSIVNLAVCLGQTKNTLYNSTSRLAKKRLVRRYLQFTGDLRNRQYALSVEGQALLDDVVRFSTIREVLDSYPNLTFYSVDTFTPPISSISQTHSVFIRESLTASKSLLQGRLNPSFELTMPLYAWHPHFLLQRTLQGLLYSGLSEIEYDFCKPPVMTMDDAIHHLGEDSVDVLYFDLDTLKREEGFEIMKECLLVGILRGPIGYELISSVEVPETAAIVQGTVGERSILLSKALRLGIPESKILRFDTYESEFKAFHEDPDDTQVLALKTPLGAIARLERKMVSHEFVPINLGVFAKRQTVKSNPDVLRSFKNDLKTTIQLLENSATYYGALGDYLVSLVEYDSSFRRFPILTTVAKVLTSESAGIEEDSPSTSNLSVSTRANL